MKKFALIAFLFLARAAAGLDTCLVGHNLLGKYDPAAGESRVGHVLIDSKTFHLDTAGGFTGVLKVRKSQLQHEHFFQATRPIGNYHFYFGQVGSDPFFRFEIRDKNDLWCNSDAAGTIVLNQVHEIVFQLVSTTNSMRAVIDGTAYETKCPADFVWEDLETLGTCFGGRWNSGTSSFTCQSDAYGSTLGAYYYDGVLRMDQTRQILDSIVVDAPDSCAACASGSSALVTIPINNLVVSIDDHVFKTGSAGSSTYNVYSGSSVVNFGEKTWNIFSNGGFTFITKLKIDSSVSFAYTQPRIFVAHDGTSINPDGLRFQLQGSATSPTIYHVYGQGGSFCGTYNIPVPTDQFLSLVWRYKLGNDRPTLEINGALATGTNTGTCGANFLTSDRTLTNNKMNQQESGTIENFAGEIAGFYGWDRWLDDTEAQTVLDSILVHENDVLRHRELQCEANTYKLLKNFARSCGSTQDQSCPATSSSEPYWGEAFAPGKINDGDISTFWHSGGESEPLYLKIDLQRVVNIQYVTITPRQNGHQGRLANLLVRVGDNPDAYDNTVCGDVGSWSDGDTASRNIACVASGRYIFLTDGPADKATNVAQLEAWGSECINCPANHLSPAGSTSVDDCVELQCEANAYKSTTMLDLHKMCGADSAQNCATSAGSGEGFYTGSSAALLDGVLSGDAHRWHSAKGFG